MTRSLSARQREVLAFIIDETAEQAPPTYGRIVSETGIPEATVRLSLTRLQERGYIEQDYEYGPYRPIRTHGGLPIALELKIMAWPCLEYGFPDFMENPPDFEYSLECAEQDEVILRGSDDPEVTIKLEGATLFLRRYMADCALSVMHLWEPDRAIKSYLITLDPILHESAARAAQQAVGSIMLKPNKEIAGGVALATHAAAWAISNSNGPVAPDTSSAISAAIAALSLAYAYKLTGGDAVAHLQFKPMKRIWDIASMSYSQRMKTLYLGELERRICKAVLMDNQPPEDGKELREWVEGVQRSRRLSRLVLAAHARLIELNALIGAFELPSTPSTQGPDT